MATGSSENQLTTGPAGNKESWPNVRLWKLRDHLNSGIKDDECLVVNNEVIYIIS